MILGREGGSEKIIAQPCSRNLQYSLRIALKFCKSFDFIKRINLTLNKESLYKLLQISVKRKHSRLYHLSNLNSYDTFLRFEN